ncbi:hypothetical protein EV186_11220 [Labedaea rhizosphaerae]|uniref:Uncharacterized protein n=2 Tax=Labedaea rhizosphaerae TaxID=598644 RepID=A0A4R6RS49_LABRH|nr:hypothetical protein EV186_11220 [Labedaea rhizosphaerae]
MNEAQAERAAAEAALANTPEGAQLTDAEIHAMIDSLGDIGAVMGDARPGTLARLYKDLGLALRYEPGEQAVYATASPRVAGERVREAICALTTRLTL